ncbi:hypothetical protein [Polymorphospora rubra]|uniref:Uncharacterized protein n=1 Tax=Polymorphospora rubra TaxID=338584 RepID=A0A810NG85_9ACTN|nr:hypothetical protein [Polymorphospora rubra]BCJ70453.1 hypothetical protein Prubr_74740 [Polymorphospora rubra]
MDRPRWLSNPGDPDPDERRKAPPRRWPALPPEPPRNGFAVRRDWPDGTHTYFGLSRTVEQAQRRLTRDRDYWQLGPLRPAAWSVVEITRYEMNAHYNQTDCRSPDCPIGIPDQVPGDPAPAELPEEPAGSADGRRWSLRALLRRLINRRVDRLVEHPRAFWRPLGQAMVGEVPV